jgi:hypothetical protein
MNDDTGVRRRLRRMWRPRTGLLAVVAGIALLTAACSGNLTASSGGSSATHGPASSSTGGSTSSSTVGGPSTLQKQLAAYSKCMRSHGVPMPDLPAPAGTPSSNSTAMAPPVNGPSQGSPQWQAAQQACQSLMPPSIKGGPGPGG